MNDEKIVTIEKKATNKIGLLFLMIFVLAGLGLGAYYYITNKNLIAFEFKMPWQKEKEEDKEDTTVVNGKENSKKPKEEKPLEREAVEINLNDNFYSDENIEIIAVSNELKEGAYIIGLKMNNTTSNERPVNTILKIKAIAVDNQLMTQSFTLQAGPGETSNYQLVIPSQELDKNRIASFSELRFLGEYTVDNETKDADIILSTTNNDTKSDINTIATLDTVDKRLRVEYYKKEETSDSTKVYFLIVNNNEKKYIYHIDRLVVNDKDVDASQYSETIYGNTSYIPILELPKSILTQNKKIKISFIFQTENKSIYRTIEKEIKL